MHDTNENAVSAQTYSGTNVHDPQKSRGSVMGHGAFEISLGERVASLVTVADLDLVDFRIQLFTQQT
jgi:hypothetical protein